VDGLTTEEMFPFVSRVLENANNWMVHTTALLLRSRLESSKSRTVERSALQLQALVDQFDLKDEGSIEERLEWFYSLLVPAKWHMEVSHSSLINCLARESLGSCGSFESVLQT
jgi:hypothetical protein